MQEVVENIALEKLKPFPNHPFKIREDEANSDAQSHRFCIFSHIQQEKPQLA